MDVSIGGPTAEELRAAAQGDGDSGGDTLKRLLGTMAISGLPGAGFGGAFALGQAVANAAGAVGTAFHAANLLGEGGAGMYAAPLFARQRQIAERAPDPLPGAAAVLGMAGAPPSLLPGVSQLLAATGALPAPTQSYGENIGTAYRAAERGGGGLEGLGAALEYLAGQQHAAPETVPATKFLAEQALNPLNLAPELRAVHSVPLLEAIGKGTTQAFNAPFTAAKQGFQQLPWASQLSDYSVQQLERRFTSDLLSGLGAKLDASQIRQQPGGPAAALREAWAGQRAYPEMDATASVAETAARLQGDRLAATEAAKATEQQAEQALGGLDWNTVLRPYNNRAEQFYRTTRTLLDDTIHARAPRGDDLPIGDLLTILDNEGASRGYLTAVDNLLAREGIRGGQVQGIGGEAGLTSARTGELRFSADTPADVTDTVRTLQADGRLPVGEEVVLSTLLRWGEQRYGALFPAPPPGVNKYWGALARHLEHETAPTGQPRSPSSGGGVPVDESLPPPGTVAGVPPEPPTGVPLAADAATGAELPRLNAWQRLAQAEQGLRIARQEKAPVADLDLAQTTLAQARADVKAAEAAGLGADITEASALRQAATGQYLQEGLTPEQLTHLEMSQGRMTRSVDAYDADLLKATALREQVGLPADAPFSDVVRTIAVLGKAGQIDSQVVQDAQAIAGRWGKEDILRADPTDLITTKMTDQFVKDLGLNPGQFGGPEWLNAITGAWRAQALFSGGYHIKNAADSIIKSFLDTQSPGFVAGAKPWNPLDMARLMKRAWQETTQDPQAVVSPQLRVWERIHGLTVPPAALEAPNPTLQAALAALSPDQLKQALSGLSPAERALMQINPELALPHAITGGGLSTQGVMGGQWTSKIPGIGGLLGTNLQFGRGLEVSARSAAFMETYGDEIAKGAHPAEAYQAGIDKAHTLFFDYTGGLTNLDRLLQNALAFHIFGTRNLAYWGPVMASHPIIARALTSYSDWTEEQAKSGGYQNFRRAAESAPVPLVGGLGSAIADVFFNSRGGTLFFSPMAYLAIADQITTDPQEYRDESGAGKWLAKARSYGLGLAPWVDVPLTMAGVYGSRPPSSILTTDPLLRSGAQWATGQAVELPWQTAQTFRLPEGVFGATGRRPNDPAGMVRQRLIEQALRERSDFAMASPAQPIAPEYQLAMLEGGRNPLFRDAASQMGREQFMTTLGAKLSGMPMLFQTPERGVLQRVEGNLPRDASYAERQQYQRQRAAALPPESTPLLTAGAQAAQRPYGERGGTLVGTPQPSKAQWLADEWKHATPARKWALVRSEDPEIQAALPQILARNVKLTPVGGR